MTVTPMITVSDGRLAVRGRTVLTGVPDNVAASHASGAGLVDGALVGADAGEAKSIHVFKFGTLRDCRFLCLFRFKLWWMTQRMGVSGRDVPLETQFMLIEVPPTAASDGEDDDKPVYVVMLPLLEGQFRAALQGNEDDELQICIESGDKAVETERWEHMVYVHAGDNPFDAVTGAVKAVEKHTQTFHHREKKRLPSFLDWFGWCTWDAFYTDVTADGVKSGLRSLSEGGAPPRFLIIDDGWQQIGTEDDDKPKKPDVAVQEGAQFASRLTGIKENAKFRPADDEDAKDGLKRLVAETKQVHGVKQVYVWHAMAGYWGGVTPAAGTGMERYEPALAYPVQCPGVTGNQPDIVMDSLSVLGLGLVHPRKVLGFYSELHSYLAGCGVDGVKVDVQNIIETLGTGHGGRVAITRAYHRALEASVARSFPDNGCISCMCHNTDMLYSARLRRLLPARPGVAHRPRRLRRVQHALPRRVHAAGLGYVPQLAPGGGVPRRGEGDRRLPDLRERQAGEPQLRAAAEARPPRRLRAPRAAPRPAHPRLPLLRPGARRREPAQGLEPEQVRRRGGRVQLPGRRVVPRGQAHARARRGPRDAHRLRARRRRRRHRARRRRRMGRRGRGVRAPRRGAGPAAPRRRAAGDARGARVRGVPRLPRPRRGRRLVRAGRAARHVQRRRRRRGVRREGRSLLRVAQGARVQPVRRLLLAEAGEVRARRGRGEVQLRRRYGARRH